MSETTKTITQPGYYEGYMVAVVWPPCQNCLRDGLQAIERGTQTAKEIATKVSHAANHAHPDIGNACPHCGDVYPPPTENRIVTDIIYQGELFDAGT